MADGILSRSITAAKFQLESDGQTKIISDVRSSYEFALLESSPDLLALFDPKLGITIDQAWDLTSHQRLLQRAVSPLEQILSADPQELALMSDRQGTLIDASKGYLPWSKGQQLLPPNYLTSAKTTVLSRTLVYTSLDMTDLPLFNPKMKLVKLYTNIMSNMEAKLRSIVDDTNVEVDEFTQSSEERARDLIRDYGESSIPVIGNLIFTGTIAPDIISLLLRAAANANITDGIEALFQLLERALNSTNPGLRYAAVEGLSSMKGQRSRSLIRARLANEQNRSVKAAMRVAL